MSMCCIKGRYTCLHKGVKFGSSVTEYFWGIFVVITQHQKGYLIYVPSIRKIVSSHDVVFDETFISALAYTSCQYSEALETWPAVSYIAHTTSPHEKTGKIVTFSHSEEWSLARKKHNGEVYELILDSIYESSTDNESDDEYISTNALEYIQDEKYVHPDINTRDARFKMLESIKKAQSECKVAELSDNRMGKDLHKWFKTVVNELNNSLPTLV